MGDRRVNSLPTTAVMMLVVLLLSACRGDGTPTVPPDAARVPDDQVVPLLSEASSGVGDERREVIRTEEAWTDFWDRVYGRRIPVPERPPIDFADHMVIAASMGTRPSGGYAIEIEAVHRRDGTLYVTVHETSPGDDCFVTAALTAPVTAVRVPAGEWEVVFVERESVHECS